MWQSYSTTNIMQKSAVMFIIYMNALRSLFLRFIL